MQKLLFLSLTAAVFSVFISSCSSNQFLVEENAPEPEYAYSRVYVGNKVVFREVRPHETEVLLSLHDLKEIKRETEEEEVLPGHTDEASEKPSLIPSKHKGELHPVNLKKRFVKNLHSIRNHSLANSILKQQLQPSERMETAAGDDQTSNTISTGQIFALIGFIFGLLSFLGSFWVAGAVVGIVFSILGWNSEWHIFALLGLIFSLAGILLYVVL